MCPASSMNTWSIFQGVVETMGSPVIEKPVQGSVSQTYLTAISFFTYTQKL